MKKTEMMIYPPVLNESYPLTNAEKDEISLKIALVGKIISAREKHGISQRKLAEIAGVQPISVARLENMKSIPSVSTIFKVLKPLGYTLAIVPDQQNHR